MNEVMMHSCDHSVVQARNDFRPELKNMDDHFIQLQPYIQTSGLNSRIENVDDHFSFPFLPPPPFPSTP
jgi:hypothetical protein